MFARGMRERGKVRGMREEGEEGGELNKERELEIC